MIKPTLNNISGSLYCVGAFVLSVLNEKDNISLEELYELYKERYEYISLSVLQLAVTWLYVIDSCYLTEDGLIKCS